MGSVKSAGFIRNFSRIAHLFLTGSDGAYAKGYGFLLVLLTLAKVYCAYLFTSWNRRFYDTIGEKNFQGFLSEACFFVVLALVFVLLVSFTQYIYRLYTLRWRHWLTDRAIALWLERDRPNIEGVDQRIQEDLMLFTDRFETLALEMVNNTVILLIFIPSIFLQTQAVKVFGFSIPGLLFYVALAYTVFGFWVSKNIAGPLVELEYDSQKCEADLRFNLVKARIGKDCDQKLFRSIFSVISDNHISLYKKKRNFSFWQISYDQFSFLIPFMVLGHEYFNSAMTLGALMHIKSMFSRIRNAMAYFLDHYSEVTELMAITQRVSEFFTRIDFFDHNPKETLELNKE